MNGAGLRLPGGASVPRARAGQTNLGANRNLCHPFTITLTLYVFTMVYQAMGDVEKTRDYADRLITFCKRQGSFPFLSQGMVLKAWVEYTLGRGKLKVDKMHAGLKRHLETGAIVTHTYLAALLAEALAAIGSFDQALGLIRSGLKMTEEHGDRRWLADLHRVHGDCWPQSLSLNPMPHWPPMIGRWTWHARKAPSHSSCARWCESSGCWREVKEHERRRRASRGRTADLKDAEALLTVNKLRFAKAVQVP